jgi:putative addiction module component (TIGR02574 family)
MSATPLSALLNLPPGVRADLAIALRESLSDAERSNALPLEPELVAELDRRWAEHVADPDSAIPWEPSNAICGAKWFQRFCSVRRPRPRRRGQSLVRVARYSIGFRTPSTFVTLATRSWCLPYMAAKIPLAGRFGVEAPGSAWSAAMPRGPLTKRWSRRR